MGSRKSLEMGDDPAGAPPVDDPNDPRSSDPMYARRKCLMHVDELAIYWCPDEGQPACDRCFTKMGELSGLKKEPIWEAYDQSKASLETKLTGLQTCGDKIDAAIVAFPGEKDRMLEESGSKMQELTSAFAEIKQLVEQREHEWVRELKEAEGERLSGLAEHMEMLTLVRNQIESQHADTSEMLYERPMSDFFKQFEGEVTALDKLVQKANRRDLNPTKGPLFDKSVATSRVKMELDGLDPCLGKPAAKEQKTAAAPIPQVKTVNAAEGTEDQTLLQQLGFGGLNTATADSTQECENLRAQVRDLQAQLQAAGITAAAPIPQVKTGNAAEGTENQTSAPVEEESSGGFGFGAFGFGGEVSPAGPAQPASTEPYTHTAEPEDNRMECINCRCLYTVEENTELCCTHHQGHFGGAASSMPGWSCCFQQRQQSKGCTVAKHLPNPEYRRPEPKLSKEGLLDRAASLSNIFSCTP